MKPPGSSPEAEVKAWEASGMPVEEEGSWRQREGAGWVEAAFNPLLTSPRKEKGGAQESR